MILTLGNRMMQLFLRIDPDAQQALVEIAEQMDNPEDEQQEPADDVKSLRLAVSKKGSK